MESAGSSRLSTSISAVFHFVLLLFGLWLHMFGKSTVSSLSILSHLFGEFHLCLTKLAENSCIFCVLSPFLTSITSLLSYLSCTARLCLSVLSLCWCCSHLLVELYNCGSKGILGCSVASQVFEHIRSQHWRWPEMLYTKNALIRRWARKEAQMTWAHPACLFPSHVKVTSPAVLLPTNQSSQNWPCNNPTNWAQMSFSLFELDLSSCIQWSPIGSCVASRKRFLEPWHWADGVLPWYLCHACNKYPEPTWAVIFCKCLNEIMNLINQTVLTFIPSPNQKKTWWVEGSWQWLDLSQMMSQLGICFLALWQQMIPWLWPPALKHTWSWQLSN